MDSSDQVRYDWGGWLSGPCLPSDDQEQLWKLRVTWQNKYVIDVNADGIWRAYRAHAADADHGRHQRRAGHAAHR